MFKVILMSALCFLFLNNDSYASEENRIGTIDFQEVLDHSLEGKSVQKKIRQKGEELKSLLEEAQVDIKRLQATYKNEALLMSEEEKKEKLTEYQQKINDFRKLQQDSGREFSEFRAKLIDNMKKEVKEYAEKKGEEEKYLLIIERRSGTVLYARNSMNITDQIIQDYDKSKKGKKNQE